MSEETGFIGWLKKASPRERAALAVWNAGVFHAIDAGLNVSGSYLSTSGPRGAISMTIKARKPRRRK